MPGSTLRLHWDKPEDDMNKVMTAAIIAGGLMLLNSPEAAAHKEVRYSYEPPPHYRHYRGVDVRRSKHMPRWLKHDDSFRHWYRHTSLRRDLRLGWYELFDIYRWERRWDRRWERRYDRRHDRRRDYRHERRRKHH